MLYVLHFDYVQYNFIPFISHIIIYDRRAPVKLEKGRGLC